MKIGVILKSLFSSQAAFCTINQINILNQTTDNVGSLFYINRTFPCVRTICCSTTIDRIVNFDGAIIATDIDSARILLRNNCKKKLYYLWDLEWLRKNYNQEEIKVLYTHPQMTYICRSNDHADEFEKLTGNRPKVIENFDLQRIIKECVTNG